MNTLKRGAFILLEGIDKCGKSTIAKCLVDSLNNKGYKCELLHFPDRTTYTGRLINEYLKNDNLKLNNEAIHLLFAANRWENIDKIKELLHKGITLVVDRYSYSGIAYSVAKSMLYVSFNLDKFNLHQFHILFSSDMDISWCKRPENGLPKPDLIFLLHLDDEEIAKRLNANTSDTERYENFVMQKKVADTYRNLVENDWHVIDANDSIENLESLLTQLSEPVIERVSNSPLQHLNFD